MGSVPEVFTGEPITPHNAALLETGKRMMLESLEVGRDFCKSMLNGSVAAVPVYLALLKLALPDRYPPSTSGAAILLAPVVAFMTGAAIFVAGYLPRTATFSLDLPAEIEEARRAATLRRRRFGVAGFVLFTLGVVSGCAATAWAFGRPLSP